jgi:hypothetical protein
MAFASSTDAWNYYKSLGFSDEMMQYQLGLTPPAPVVQQQYAAQQQAIQQQVAPTSLSNLYSGEGSWWDTFAGGAELQDLGAVNDWSPYRDAAFEYAKKNNEALYNRGVLSRDIALNDPRAQDATAQWLYNNNKDEFNAMRAFVDTGAYDQIREAQRQQDNDANSLSGFAGDFMEMVQPLLMTAGVGMGLNGLAGLAGLTNAGVSATSAGMGAAEMGLGSAGASIPTTSGLAEMMANAGAFGGMDAAALGAADLTGAGAAAAPSAAAGAGSAAIGATAAPVASTSTITGGGAAAGVGELATPSWVNDLLSQTGELGQTAAQLEGGFSGISGQLGGITGQLGALQGQLANTPDWVNQLLSETGELGNTAASLEGGFSGISGQLGGLTGQLGALQGQLAQTPSWVNDLLAETGELGQTASSLESGFGGIQSALQGLQNPSWLQDLLAETGELNQSVQALEGGFNEAISNAPWWSEMPTALQNAVQAGTSGIQQLLGQNNQQMQQLTQSTQNLGLNNLLGSMLGFYSANQSGQLQKELLQMAIDSDQWRSQAPKYHQPLYDAATKGIGNTAYGQSIADSTSKKMASMGYNMSGNQMHEVAQGLNKGTTDYVRALTPAAMGHGGVGSTVAQMTPGIVGAQNGQYGAISSGLESIFGQNGMFPNALPGLGQTIQNAGSSLLNSLV